jgi:hypothetical protein
MITLIIIYLVSVILVTIGVIDSLISPSKNLTVGDVASEWPVILLPILNTIIVIMAIYSFIISIEIHKKK